MRQWRPHDDSADEAPAAGLINPADAGARVGSWPRPCENSVLCYDSRVNRRGRAMAGFVEGVDRGRNEHLIALATRYAVPTSYANSAATRAGGLMSYGYVVNEVYRQMGIYVGRVLNGEKPGDLPVVQSTRIELVINMKAAKTLGITFPVSLLARADEVIE
jgi:hypothetical protein